MITIKDDRLFVLDTDNTTYAFRVLPTKHLEHLYYGRKIRIESDDGLAEHHEFAPGNSSVYDQENGSKYTLDDMRLEISTSGKGDLRMPAIRLINGDGSTTSDFLYESSRVVKGKRDEGGLPGSYGEDAETLEIHMIDRENRVGLKLSYTVFAECDVITRSASVANLGEEDIQIGKIMSLQLDFDKGDYTFTTFTGGWTSEMQRNDTKVRGAALLNSSDTGSSSNRANPFVMISRGAVDESYGEVYGFNLIYSGNHMESCERNPYGKMRFLCGINPDSFNWKLAKGESFDSPEAVMTFSCSGYNGQSQNMHRFVKDHIVRGAWKDRLRPVLLNSWEASYFKITERSLMKLARRAAGVGVELFVMDDGWFGKRNDDTSSLGDWHADTKKLPHGIKGLCDKVRKTGMMFGIWVEPEMVNRDSDLYREHPDWALRIPGKHHSEGRSQMILDLTRPDVREYVIEAMTDVFSSADISYVKWDYNRNFTDVFSQALPKDRQKETAHRYILGLYAVLRELMKRFPDILFEGCASGGNRFDLGMLCFFPQIWCSDDTDAVCRAGIQNGYSYGYPQSTYTAHVSDVPNHQTLRRTPMNTRFNVASYGVMGYECNLCDMNRRELREISEQIRIYKEMREVSQFGSFYRSSSFEDGDMSWTVVSQDKKTAYSFTMHILAEPNQQSLILYPRGLSEDVMYHLQGRELTFDLRDMGSLVNTVSPIHIKPGGIIHTLIARFNPIKGEREEHTMYGGAMMYGGVHLKSAFASVGFNDEIRFYPDHSSRVYSVKAVI